MLSILVDPNSPLTPSELVLLNAEKFAKRPKLGGMQVLGKDLKVSIPDLGQAVLATALLANERAGSLRLEVREKKALFRKVDSLFAVPVAQAAAWPSPSLENDLHGWAMKLQDAGQNLEVSDLLYAWLGKDTASPWQNTIENLMLALSDRGLLLKVEEKKLKIFKVTHFELAEGTAALASQSPTSPIEQLLKNCESMRPQVWQLVVKHINRAINRRTIQTDTDWD